jgi:hypothetical protein
MPYGSFDGFGAVVVRDGNGITGTAANCQLNKAVKKLMSAPACQRATALPLPHAEFLYGSHEQARPVHALVLGQVAVIVEKVGHEYFYRGVNVLGGVKDKTEIISGAFPDGER